MGHIAVFMPTKHQPDYSSLEVKILLMGHIVVFKTTKYQPDYSYLRQVPLFRVHLLK
jgi:hypothetical protein